MVQTRSTGWQLTLTHPDTGRTISPDILDDPEFLPSLNSLARVRVPVRASDRWSQWPSGADMTLSLDGREQPVDELLDIEQEAGRTVLVGEGGTELTDRVTAEYDLEKRHIAAKDLIEAETSYAADVDTPNVSGLEDQLLRELSTTQDFLDNINPASTDPIAISGDTVTTYDTTFPIEVQSFTALDPGVTVFSSSDGYENGSYLLFDAEGQYAEYEFSIGYEMPADVLYPAMHARTVDSNRMQFQMYVNNDVEAGATVDDTELAWYNTSEFGATVGFTLSPGTHTVRYEVSNLPDGPAEAEVDFFDLQDGRYNYIFDDTLSSPQGHFDGPQTKPDAVFVETVDASTAFVVVAGEAILAFDDVSNKQRLEISNDGGNNWIGADNSDTVSGDFQDDTSSLRWRARLSRYGERDTQTPRTGFKGQTISSSELRADLRQQLLLIDQLLDDSLENVLNEIAGDMFIWSYQVIDGQPTIIWTQPGQRTTDETPSIDANVTTRKQLGTWDAATIKGSAQTVTDERFSASTNWLSLNQDDLVNGSESVRDPTDGTPFVRGDDYEMKYRSGEIRILSGGNMSSGTQYAIGYRYTSGATYPSDYDDTGDELVRTVPGIVSDQQAEQIAFTLLEVDPEISKPRYEADVLLPRSGVAFDPIEALSLEALDLPAEAFPLAVREPPEQTPEGIRLRLGSRRELEAALRSISEQVSTVSRRS